MIEDVLARQLHDRKTRGNALTEPERVQLEAWYARQDAEEATELAASKLAASALESLRSEVSEALTQLQEVTGRIQAQSDINEALRQEVIKLSRRLTVSAPSKAT